MVWNWIRRSTTPELSADSVLLETLADMGGVDHLGAVRIQLALQETARRGPDLAAATDYLMGRKVKGLSRIRAAEVAQWVCAVAKATADRQQWLELGFTEGKWLSGGLCVPRWREPTKAEFATSGIHQRLSGNTYPLRHGVMIKGEHVYPGTMPACTCVSGPVIAGFN